MTPTAPASGKSSTCTAPTSPGTLTNLARLLNHGRLGGTGKLVILPVDQGFEHGPARSFAPNPPSNAQKRPAWRFSLGPALSGHETMHSLSTTSASGSNGSELDNALRGGVCLLSRG